MNSYPSANAIGKRSTEDEMSDLSMPRSEWLSRVMRKHIDVLELRERLRPISAVHSFARNKISAKTEVKEILSDDVVDELIMQFLAEENYTTTLQVLEKDLKTNYKTGKIEPESIQTLLRVGIKDTKNLFAPLPEAEDNDLEVEAYRSYVYDTEVEGDTHLWDETADSTENTIVNGNVIVAGTLNKLVLWLTNSDKHDMEFRKAFFMTHQSFTTSERLLAKLIQRYNIPSNIEVGPASDQSLVIVVLKFWVDNYGYDFNEKLLLSLNNFIDTTLAREGHADWAKQLRGVIAKLEKSTDSATVLELALRREPVEPKVPKNIFSPTLTLDDIDEEEVARQMSIIDWNLYTVIRPNEFLLKSWTRNISRAPNLITLQKRYNDITKWAATSILNDRKVQGKGRAKSLARFLRIADHLRNLNNFLSLGAIYTGIANTAVFNLKGLTRELSKQQLETLHELERLFSCKGSYKNYRTAYNSAKPPCIPFIGVHLRDVSIVEDCDMDKITGLINFSKRLVLYRIITATLRYQPIPYPYYTVHQVAVFLQGFTLESNKSIYDRAILLNTEDVN